MHNFCSIRMPLIMTPFYSVPMPIKILIDKSPYCLFLSTELQTMYLERTASVKRGPGWSYFDIPRDDPVLIGIVEEIGLKRAGRELSMLKIVEIPDGVVWQIMDDDGEEYVEEVVRRVWR